MMNFSTSQNLYETLLLPEMDSLFFYTEKSNYVEQLIFSAEIPMALELEIYNMLYVQEVIFLSKNFGLLVQKLLISHHIKIE